MSQALRCKIAMSRTNTDEEIYSKNSNQEPSDLTLTADEPAGAFAEGVKALRAIREDRAVPEIEDFTHREMSRFETTSSTATTTTLGDFIQEIKSDQHKAVCDFLRSPDTDQGSRDKAKKERLPGCTLSVVCNGTRKADNAVTHSGLFQIDFDLKDNPDLPKRLPKIRKSLLKLDHHAGNFVSPSGGLKVIVAVDFRELDTAGHKHAWQLACEDIANHCGLIYDQQCSDLARLCFASHDKSAVMIRVVTPLSYVAPVPVEQAVNTAPSCTVSTVERPDRNSLIHRASLWLAKAEPAVEGQSGHSKLLWAAQGLVNGFQLSRSDALNLLWSDYNPRCSPSWNRADQGETKKFERKVDQAMSNPVKTPGWLLSSDGYTEPSAADIAECKALSDRYADEIGKPEQPAVPADKSEGIAQAAKYDNTNKHNDEPVPLPDRRRVEPLTSDMLPPIIAEWAKDVSVRSSCPFEYTAVGGIMALSTALGKSVAVLPKRQDTWHEYGNLWGICVGSPSVMKSHPVKEMLKPVESIQASKGEIISKDVEKWQKESAIITLKNGIIEADNKKTLKSAIENDEDYDSVELKEPIEIPARPVEPLYLAKNITPEKLETELKANPRGITVYRDELRSLFSTFTKTGHEESRGLYLSGWSGKEALDTRRISRDKVVLPSYALGVIGTIQPGPLGEFVSESGTKGDDGFIQRFGLMVWPDESSAFKSVDLAPNLMARRAYVDCVKRLADVNQGGQKIGYEVEGVTGAAIRFSEEAAALFDEWTCKHMNRIRLENECEGLESHLTKYKKLVPSLALLYHVSSLGCADSTADIEPHSVEQAIKLANILESHARKVYSDEVSPEIKAAKALLSLAKEVSKEKAVWRPRDIYRRQRSGLKTAAEVEQAAKMLIEYGHLLSPEQFKELKKGQYSFNLMYHPEIEY